jgi:hypothetical protein
MILFVSCCILLCRPSASGEQSGAEHGCLPLLLCTRAAADAASGYKALDGLTSLLEVIGSDEVRQRATLRVANFAEKAS